MRIKSFGPGGVNASQALIVQISNKTYWPFRSVGNGLDRSEVFY